MWEQSTVFCTVRGVERPNHFQAWKSTQALQKNPHWSQSTFCKKTFSKLTKCVMVWRDPDWTFWNEYNVAHYQKNTTPTVKHGGGRKILWGHFFFSLNWGFFKVEGIINRTKCQSVTTENQPEKKFEHSKTLKQTSKPTADGLHHKMLRVMEWLRIWIQLKISWVTWRWQMT